MHLRHFKASALASDAAIEERSAKGVALAVGPGQAEIVGACPTFSAYMQCVEGHCELLIL